VTRRTTRSIQIARELDACARLFDRAVELLSRPIEWTDEAVADDRPAPIIMERGDVINVARAAAFAGRDEKTVRRWSERFGIGRQCAPGAPWEISAPALLMLMQGDHVALEMLRGGDRESDRVVRYFDRLGISTARDRII